MYYKFLILQFEIKKGNNAGVVRKCMTTRINWKENKEKKCNFMWQGSSYNINYENLVKSNNTKNVS